MICLVTFGSRGLGKRREDGGGDGVQCRVDVGGVECIQVE